MTTAPNGELRRQDFHLQVQQLVSLRSLLWVLPEMDEKPLSLVYEMFISRTHSASETSDSALLRGCSLVEAGVLMSKRLRVACWLPV